LKGGRDTRQEFQGYEEKIYSGKCMEKFQPLAALDVVLPIQSRTASTLDV
jgi:hypothetical protein